MVLRFKSVVVRSIRGRCSWVVVIRLVLDSRVPGVLRCICLLISMVIELV